MRLATRPAGRRLLGPTNRKVRAINQVHKGTDAHGWEDMWGPNYDWSGWLKPGIDAVAAVGANTIKISTLAASALNTSKTALNNTKADRLRQWLDYTASVGLDVYIQPEWTNSALADEQTVAVEVAKIARDYPHVIAIDLINEPDAIGAASSSTVATYASTAFAAVRQVTNIPLTISLAAITNTTYLNVLAPYVDFWDFHFYQGSTTPTPVVSDFAALRAASYRKPWLIGESGAPRQSYYGWPYGPTQQQTMWGRLGTIAQEPDCLGVVGFSLTDYDGAQFGVYGVGSSGPFVSPRSEITGPFATWPSIR